MTTSDSRFALHSCPRFSDARLRSAALLFGVLMGMGTTAPAWAQEASDEPEATSKPAASEEVVITEKARSHFRAGVNLIQDPDGARYEEAYRQFKAAHRESPSWKILGNLGVSAMKLERDGEAIDAFQTYLKEGGEEVTPQERDQFQRDIDTLQASVSTVTLSGVQRDLRLIDERVTNRGGNVTNSYAIDGSGPLVLRIRPGHHKITAKLPGYEDELWEFDANASGSYEHEFELHQPVPTTTSGAAARPADSGLYRPIPTGVWVGVGLTGAFTVGAVATGIVALGKNAEYDDANAEGDPEADDIRSQVKTFNLVTDVLIGAAVVSAAVTTVLYVTRPEKRRPTAWRLTPQVGLRGGTLHLSARF